jgi:hypothetical protein
MAIVPVCRSIDGLYKIVKDANRYTAQLDDLVYRIYTQKSRLWNGCKLLFGDIFHSGDMMSML